MKNRLKTYCVTFYVRDVYWIDIKARNKDDACSKAQSLYTRFGASPEHGFCFDISDGGHGGYTAEEVPS